MKTIIEMAREAGAYPTSNADGALLLWSAAQIERFAELVTDQANNRSNAAWTFMCKKMVAEEREACAKVAEDMNRAVLAMLNVTSQPKALAAAIRARSNT